MPAPLRIFRKCSATCFNTECFTPATQELSHVVTMTSYSSYIHWKHFCVTFHFYREVQFLQQFPLGVAVSITEHTYLLLQEPFLHLWNCSVQNGEAATGNSEFRVFWIKNKKEKHLSDIHCSALYFLLWHSPKGLHKTALTHAPVTQTILHTLNTCISLTAFLPTASHQC